MYCRRSLVSSSMDHQKIQCRLGTGVATVQDFPIARSEKLSLLELSAICITADGVRKHRFESLSNLNLKRN